MAGSRIRVTTRDQKNSETEYSVDDAKKAFSKKTAIAFADKIHAEHPELHVDVTDGRGVPIHKIEGVHPQVAVGKKSEAPAIKPDVGEEDAAPKTEGETADEATKKQGKRPEEYVVEIRGIPAEIRVKELYGGKLPPAVADGERPTSLNGKHVLAKWADAYYVCVNVAKALRARGWKTKGSWKVATWTGLKEVPGKEAQTASIVFTTHLEAILKPDEPTPPAPTGNVTVVVEGAGQSDEQVVVSPEDAETVETIAADHDLDTPPAGTPEPETDDAKVEELTGAA